MTDQNLIDFHKRGIKCIGDDAPPYEVVRCTLFDTEPHSKSVLYDGRRTLTFFIEVKRDERKGNFYLPAQLPNPQAFLISEMAISGVTPYLAEGVVDVTVGNKTYGSFPLGLFVGKRGSFEYTPCDLLIGPLQYFVVRLVWTGRGYDGVLNPEIKVSLIGRMLRPVC